MKTFENFSFGTPCIGCHMRLQVPFLAKLSMHISGEVIILILAEQALKCDLQGVSGVRTETSSRRI